MLKKTIKTSISAILLVSSTTVFANIGPYIGGTLNLTDTMSSSSSFRGLSPSVLIGFGGTVNVDFYLAGELFADFATLVLDNYKSPGASSLRSTYSYGMSVLPGLMLSNRTMAYVRLGLLRTNFSSLSSTAVGGQLGLGMQTSLTQYWDLRGEYDYVPYQKTGGVSPASDQFKLGFVYKFN